MDSAAHPDPDSHGLVVCSILERDAERTERRLEQAPSGCGLVEIRGDHLRPADLSGLVRRTGRQVVVTIRTVAEGGWFDPLDVMLKAPSAFFILGFLVWAVRTRYRKQIEHPDSRSTSRAAIGSASTM